MSDLPAWKGLLKWSMKYQDPTADNKHSNVRNMTDEDRAFLDKVMRDLVSDPIDEMRIILRVLAIGEDLVSVRPAELREALRLDPKDKDKDKNNDDEQDDLNRPFSPAELEALTASLVRKKQSLLSELDELVEHIHYANDLHKLGGLQIVIDMLSSKYPSLRWRAAGVLATVVQNNATSQENALQLGCLPKLLGNLDYASVPPEPKFVGQRTAPSSATESKQDNDCEEKDEAEAQQVDDRRLTQVKSILALSSLIRNHRDATAQFLKAGGVPQLVKVLCAKDNGAESRLLRKALSLLHWLWQHDENLRNKASSKTPQVFPKLADLLLSDDVDLREGALKALLLLVTDHPKNRMYARLDQFGIKHKLKERRKTINKEKDEYAIESELPLIRKLSSSL
eukprot:TRINITY_DN50020_c1_g1_i1.p1 TRINITY_DN50020_c1_g1~~TRINITY_DN50020_c1_g1_i1.p1  ORF type:complete len:428 (+),score=219.48 TRINITY_DN50020_c1_g1_i1:97-1284(+)